MKCPKCNNKKTQRDGFEFSIKRRRYVQRYRCPNCKKRFQEYFIKPDIKIDTPIIPNVLLLDIETTPILGLFWGAWKQNIQPHFVLEDWNIICWSAKWLFHNELVSDYQTSEEALRRDDKRIMKSLLKLLNQADIIIAHNLDKFDLPRINTRLILNDLQPYSPVQTIDTLKIVKKPKNGFAFTYNRLDYLGQLIRNKGKIETDWSLWVHVLNGSAEHLEYMSKYCDEDVLLLEEVYVYLRAWIKSHPNLNLYAETTDRRCNNCLSDKLKENGEYYTPANVFKSYICESCGCHLRSRLSKLSKQQKDNLLLSQAR